MMTYLHPDILGSPRRATDMERGTLWQGHYDPYGKKVNSVNEKIGYTGHAYDPETQYTYMQARFYDAVVGRFLSNDPIHFTDDNPFTFNRYSYANNNPYKYIDPSGSISLSVLSFQKNLSRSDAMMISKAGTSSLQAGGGAIVVGSGTVAVGALAVSSAPVIASIVNASPALIASETALSAAPASAALAAPLQAAGATVSQVATRGTLSLALELTVDQVGYAGARAAAARGSTTAMARYEAGQAAGAMQQELNAAAEASKQAAQKLADIGKPFVKGLKP